MSEISPREAPLRSASLSEPVVLSAFSRKMDSGGLLKGFDHVRSHTLTEEEIDRAAVRGSSGRFVLGFRDARGAFRNQFAGFSGDMNADLKRLVGLYREFKVLVQ